MSKFASFAKGYGLGTKMAEDYEEAQMKKELKGLAEAEVQTTGGQEANPAQVQQQLDAGAGMGEARTLAGARQPSQYTHLGKTQDTPFTEQQKAQNQTLAMAQVIKKRDPMRGLQLEQAAKNQERADTEFGWKAGDREREEKKRQGIESANLESANYLKSLTGPDGAARAPTIDDLIEAQSRKTHALASTGHMDEALNAMQLTNAATYAKIKNETELRNAALGKAIVAAQSGDTKTLTDFYNRFVPDGANVTGVERGKNGEIIINRQSTDGRQLAPTTLKDMGQLTATLQAFSDPMALYKYTASEREWQLKQNADKRDGARLGLQSAQTEASVAHSNASTAEIKAKTEDRVELNKIHAGLGSAIESGDKKAEDTERRKLETYIRAGKGGSVMTALEKEANLNLASGRAKTMVEAIELAKQKSQKSPADTYIEFRAKGLAPDEISREMTLLHGDNWRNKVSSQGGLSSAKPNQDAAMQEANRAIASGAPKDAVIKRLKDSGYDTKGL